MRSSNGTLRFLLILLSWLSFVCQASAFHTPHVIQSTTATGRRPTAPGQVQCTSTTVLHAITKQTSKLPTYDKATQRWVSNDSDGDGAYGPLDSLLRFGPKPFLKRLTDADNVEQAVLKYQAGEQCSRLEAECNMDAFNENVQDWIQQKTEEQRGISGPRDYTYLDTQKIVLSVTWGVLITTLLVWASNNVLSGGYCANFPDARFCEIFPPSQ